MKRAMILFAKGFPYNTSEPFLEAEYPLYHHFFDKVLIVTGCQRNELPTRHVKDPNIEIICDHTLYKDILSIIRAVPWTLSDRMVYREIWSLIKSHSFTAKRLFQLMSITLCGNHRAILAAKWLKSHPEYSVDVVYSYWLQIPAYANVRFNEKVLKSHAFSVSRAHGFDVYEDRMTTKYQPFQKQLCEHLDEVAVISKNGANYLSSRYDFADKFSVYRLGAIDHCQNNPEIDRSTFRIVSCSRVIPLKRLDRILDTLMDIRDIPIEWTHLGGGNSLSSLKDKAQQLPKNIVVNFTGTISNSDVYHTYASTPFHIFINVSETEGIPVSIMEAMSFNIPIIATDVGGTSELIDPDYNGYLLPRDFSNGLLADTIRKVQAMPDNMYNNLRFHAREKYSAEYDSLKNYRCFLTHLSAKGHNYE